MCATSFALNAVSVSLHMMCMNGSAMQSAGPIFASCVQNSGYEGIASSRFNHFNSCSSLGSARFCSGPNQAMSLPAGIGMSNVFPRTLAAASAFGLTATWPANAFPETEEKSDTEWFTPMQIISLILVGMILIPVASCLLDEYRESRKKRGSVDDGSEDVANRSDYCETVVRTTSRYIKLIQGVDDLKAFVSEYGKYLRYSIVESPDKEGEQIRVAKKDTPYDSLFHNGETVVAAGVIECLNAPIEDLLKIRITAEQGRVADNINIFKREAGRVFKDTLKRSLFSIDYSDGTIVMKEYIK